MSGAWVLALALSALPADDRGLRPALDGSPQRVVSLAPHLTESVYALGAGDRLVATVAHSDHPEAARSLPRIGDAFRVDTEQLLALSPDLILAWGGGNPAPLIQRLSETGIPVFVLRPEGLEDIAADLLILGRLLGADTRAETLAEEMRARLSAATAHEDDAPRVFIQVSDRPIYTVGGDHTIAEIVRRCGGEPVFPDIATSAAVSPEAVAAARPDVMLMLAERELAERWWSGWSELGALPDHAAMVAVEPDLVSRPGPRIVAGLERICAALEGL